MLPDFPAQKAQMKKLFDLRVEMVRSTSSPLLSLAHVSIRHEGHRLRRHREDGAIEDTTPHEFSGEVSFCTEELKEMPFEAVLEKADEMGGSLASQQAQAMYGEIAKAAQEGDTQLDAGGRPFHPDMILDMLEKMDIEFDEHGNAQLPAMFVGPQLYEHMEKQYGQSQLDPARLARKQKIVARKKEDWRAREARRRLVD